MSRPRMSEQQFRAISAGRPPRKTRPRGRMKPGEMNGHERNYAEHLNARKIAGEVIQWWYEGIGMRVAAKCHYYPDFLVMLADGSLEVHEVKARSRDGSFRCEDDAKVKLRACAEKFPFPLIVVWPRGRLGDGWERVEI